MYNVLSCMRARRDQPQARDEAANRMDRTGIRPRSISKKLATIHLTAHNIIPSRHIVHTPAYP